MKDYLQISIWLAMLFASALGWNMQPKQTVYVYTNMSPVYVVDIRWADSLGLQYLKTSDCGTCKTGSIEDSNSVYHVKLTSFEFKK